ncbi:MAG: hypothetical protein Q7U65_01220, partial [Bacteroidota bacterium]|nr:hypothetical protein [Bacteroidota bacterium]
MLNIIDRPKKYFTFGVVYTTIKSLTIMKHRNFIYFLLSIVSILAIINGCKKDENEDYAPKLMTFEVSNITNIS